MCSGLLIGSIICSACQGHIFYTVGIRTQWLQSSLWPQHVYSHSSTRVVFVASEQMAHLALVMVHKSFYLMDFLKGFTMILWKLLSLWEIYMDKLFPQSYSQSWQWKPMSEWNKCCHFFIAVRDTWHKVHHFNHFMCDLVALGTFHRDVKPSPSSISRHYHLPPSKKKTPLYQLNSIAHSIPDVR